MSALKAQVTPVASTELSKIIHQPSLINHKKQRRFWRQLLRAFMSYFANRKCDMNLEAWRRLEYRNEYEKPSPTRLNFQSLV